MVEEVTADLDERVGAALRGRTNVVVGWLSDGRVQRFVDDLAPEIVEIAGESPAVGCLRQVETVAIRGFAVVERIGATLALRDHRAQVTPVPICGEADEHLFDLGVRVVVAVGPSVTDRPGRAGRDLALRPRLGGHRQRLQRETGLERRAGIACPLSGGGLHPRRRRGCAVLERDPATVDRSQQTRSAVLDAIGGATELDVLGADRGVGRGVDVVVEPPLDRSIEIVDHPAIISCGYDSYPVHQSENINKFRRDHAESSNVY